MIVYSQESYKIIGAAFNVYNKLGHGFLEAVYQECLELEFKKQGIYSDFSSDVIRPSKEECRLNPRSKSTKMRWAIKQN